MKAASISLGPTPSDDSIEKAFEVVSTAHTRCK